MDSTDVLRVVTGSAILGDTLFHLPSGGLFEGGGLRYFTPEPIWALSGASTVAFGINSTYRIGLYGSDGALERIISRPSEPKLITERDIRAFFAYLDRAWLANGVPPARLAANHAAVRFAEFLPTFSTLQAGPQGTLWVQPVQAPGELSDEAIERYDFIEQFGATGWEVFDPEGRFMGTVTMPPRFQPRVFKGDAIYGVARDEFDVQYVVRLRILVPR
jgi:hypothetical protein